MMMTYDDIACRQCLNDNLEQKTFIDILVGICFLIYFLYVIIISIEQILMVMLILVYSIFQVFKL